MFHFLTRMRMQTPGESQKSSESLNYQVLFCFYFWWIIYLSQPGLNVASYLFRSQFFPLPLAVLFPPDSVSLLWLLKINNKVFFLFFFFSGRISDFVFCSQASFGHFLPPFLPCKCDPGLSVVWIPQQQLHCLHGHHHSPAVMWLLDSKGRTVNVFLSALTISRSICLCFVELVIYSCRTHGFAQTRLTTAGSLLWSQARYPQNTEKLKQFIDYYGTGQKYFLFTRQLWSAL